MEALAHRRFEVGVVQHVDRRLHIGERRAAAFGQPEQQAVALRILLEVARDVVQHQHEAADRTVAVVAAAHRRHLRAQQLAGARGGDELRRRAGDAALHALADVLQRVGDQLAVEHGVDRAAEADQFGAVGQTRRVGQRTELQPRAIVVEQDATVQIAHDDRLRQFRHQRGQTAAFLFDVAAGGAHLFGDVGAQPRALFDKAGDDVGQRAVLGVALRCKCALGIGAEHDARLVHQSRWRDDVAPIELVQSGRGQHQHEQQRHQRQRHAPAEQRQHGVAFGSIQRGQQQQTGHHRPQQQQSGQRRQHPPEAAIGTAVRIHPSISRTFCTSSRVEKGLVM